MEQLYNKLKEDLDDFDKTRVGLMDVKLLNISNITEKLQEKVNSAIEFFFKNYNIHSTNGKAVAHYNMLHNALVIGPETQEKISGVYTELHLETIIHNATPELLSFEAEGNTYLIIYEQGKLWQQFTKI